jgi:hypothetical protein
MHFLRYRVGGSGRSPQVRDPIVGNSIPAKPSRFRRFVNEGHSIPQERNRKEGKSETPTDPPLQVGLC